METRDDNRTIITTQQVCPAFSLEKMADPPPIEFNTGAVVLQHDKGAFQPF
jgi:hypothetical protein